MNNVKKKKKKSYPRRYIDICTFQERILVEQVIFLKGVFLKTIIQLGLTYFEAEFYCLEANIKLDMFFFSMPTKVFTQVNYILPLEAFYEVSW